MEDETMRLNQERLEALRREVPHATLSDIATVKQHDNPAVLKLNAYLHGFAKPIMPGNKCLCCERPLAGTLVDQLLSDGGFEWGLVHGQGHCRKCGWPATMYHFIKDENGEDILTMHNVLLQVHPDHIEIGRRSSAE